MMVYEICKKLSMLCAPALLAGLVGCANVASTNMIPNSFDSIKTLDKTIQVAVDTSKANDHFRNWVEDVEFKSAIEQSLVKSKLFNGVTAAAKDYQLRVTITSVGNFWGLDAKVAINTIWEVIDLHRREPIWKDIVQSEFTATLGDSLGGSKRVKLAYEGALKENIRKGINQLSSSM